MNYTISICGKGGTGKTTLAALVVKWLLKNKPGESILAVDADPNSNLDENLGKKASNNIVAVLDEMAKNPSVVPSGMTKDRYIEYRLHDILVEAQGFDLLAMGRPEGPGCYCFANSMLRVLLDELTKGYSYVVIDNEAGMEHLSRRTTRRMDLLLLVSDYSLVGLRSAKRILDLTKELQLKVKDARLAINKAPSQINELKDEIASLGIPFAGVIPEDKQILKLSLANLGIGSISDSAKSVKAVDKIFREIL